MIDFEEERTKKSPRPVSFSKSSSYRYTDRRKIFLETFAHWAMYDSLERRGSHIFGCFFEDALYHTIRPVGREIVHPVATGIARNN